MSKASTPPEIQQITALLTRLELAFARKSEAETGSSLFAAAKIKSSGTYGDYEIAHAVISGRTDTKPMHESAAFLKAESRLRNITGIYESGQERRQTGTSLESHGIHLVDEPVYNNVSFFNFYVREDDLPALLQSAEAKIAALRDAQRVANQEAENKKIGTAFLKAASPDAICGVMGFKKKNDRGPKDLIEEAETAVKIAVSAPDISSADKSGDPLIDFLKEAYDGARNGKAAIGLNSTSLLKQAANNFVDVRNLRPTMEQTGLGLAA